MDGVTRKRPRAADDDDLFGSESPAVKNRPTAEPSSGWNRTFTSDTRSLTAPDFNKEVISLRSLGTVTVFPPSRFQSGAPVNFREPLKVGEFSLDRERRFHNDSRSKKYYAFRDNEPPNRRLDLDLRKGRGRFYPFWTIVRAFL